MLDFSTAPSITGSEAGLTYLSNLISLILLYTTLIELI